MKWARELLSLYSLLVSPRPPHSVKWARELLSLYSLLVSPRPPHSVKWARELLSRYSLLLSPRPPHSVSRSRGLLSLFAFGFASTSEKRIATRVPGTGSHCAEAEARTKANSATRVPGPSSHCTESKAKVTRATGAPGPAHIVWRPRRKRQRSQHYWKVGPSVILLELAVLVNVKVFVIAHSFLFTDVSFIFPR